MSAAPALAAAEASATLAYALRWRTRNVRAGAHRGQLPVALGTFHDVAPFARMPDARRLDLRQSLRDPFGTLHVRRYRQPSGVDVAVLLDRTASMAFVGRMDVYATAVATVAGIAAAARGMGDAFGLGVGGDDDGSLSFAPTRAAPAPAVLASRLYARRPAGAAPGRLLDAARALPARRCLVFVVSDFLFPDPLLAELLAALAVHDVVPVWIDDGAQDALPAWGIAELRDLESGRRRLLWLRPRLRAAWQARREEWRGAFALRCAEAGARPFRMRDRLDLDGLGEHLLEA